MFVLHSLYQAEARVAFNNNGGLHHLHVQVDNSLQNTEADKELLEQILDEIQMQHPSHIHTEVGVEEDMELVDEVYIYPGKTSVENEDHRVLLTDEERDLELINAEGVGVDEDMEELLDEIYNYPVETSVEDQDHLERDLELINALNSLESILSFDPEHDQSLIRRRRSADQDQKLMDAMDAIESLLYSSNNRTRRSIHDNHKEESQSIEADNSDDLLDALGSLESLMRATTHSSRKRRSLPQTHDGFLYEEILEIYHLINKAEMKVAHDGKAARNLLEKAKMKLKIIAKYHRDHQDVLSKVVKRSAEDIMESGPIEALTKKMVARGYSGQEYHWLSREFDLSKEDVDEVQNLSEEEFRQFSRSLKEASSVQPMKKQYPVDELLEVFKSGRQLVPAELEAAAHGVVHVGRHLGGRARYVLTTELLKDSILYKLK